jgi:hypothetical protein
MKQKKRGVVFQAGVDKGNRLEDSEFVQMQSRLKGVAPVNHFPPIVRAIALKEGTELKAQAVRILFDVPLSAQAKGVSDLLQVL